MYCFRPHVCTRGFPFRVPMPADPSYPLHPGSSTGMHVQNVANGRHCRCNTSCTVSTEESGKFSRQCRHRNAARTSETWTSPKAVCSSARCTRNPRRLMLIVSGTQRELKGEYTCPHSRSEPSCRRGSRVRCKKSSRVSCKKWSTHHARICPGDHVGRCDEHCPRHNQCLYPCRL